MTTVGSREFKNVFVDLKGNKKVSTWYRDDGKLFYSIQPFPEAIEIIDTVRINKTVNTPDTFSCGMNYYLW